MDYLLDTNIFIEAKRRYYGMDICPGFWDWLDHAHSRGIVASVTSVCDELREGNDELAKWAKDRTGAGWFLSIDDVATQQYFAEIVRYVQSLPYTQAALDEFLRVADPWLIAKARVMDATVVTHETYDPNARRKIPIPNICRNFGLSCLDTFDLLRADTVSFVLP
jgi:hypothetical protein